MSIDQESRIPASVLVITKNEENNIVDCLASLQDFAHVAVIDSSSTDRTRDLAVSAGAEVFNFTWDGRYPKKKQWALDHCAAFSWALLLDADERLSPELVSSIRAAVAHGQHAAYDVDLEYWFLGKPLRFGHRPRKRVLVSRDNVKFPEIDDLSFSLGEVEGHYQPFCQGSVGRLAGLLIHRDRDSLTQYFDRHNRYSSWEAHLATQPNIARALPRSRKGLLGQRLPTWLRPVAFFVYSYFVKLGCLDGVAGLHFALAQANYYWSIHVKALELRGSTN